MSTQIEGLAAELEGIRSELAELDQVETPTEEQSARAEQLLSDWDDKKAAHDSLVERARRVEEVRAASIDAHVESGFGGTFVRKLDPFADLESLRFADPNGDDVVARAVTAMEQSARRGVADAAIEEVVRKVENVPGAAVLALAHGSPAYRSAFQTWLAAGGVNVAYSPEEAAAVRTAMSLTSATGGYALPTLLDPSLIFTGTATRNPIRNIARVEQGTQNVWHGVSAGNVTTYWKAEGSAFTEGSPTFAGPSVTAAMLTAYVTASYEIFQDTTLQAQLPALIRDSIDVAEAAAFVSGSGSGAPKGIVTAISATAGSTVTATTRGSFTDASAVDLFNVLNAVPVRYEDSSTWLANKKTYNTVRQMSSASYGALFWENLAPGTPAQLLGSPIAKSQDMASTTTSGTVLAILGDFSQYLVYDRLGVTVEVIPNVVDGSGLPTGQRGLVAYKRVGADVTDLNAFRFLKT